MGGKVGKQLERSGAAGKIGRQSGRMVGTWEGGRLGNSNCSVQRKNLVSAILLKIELAVEMVLVDYKLHFGMF